MPVYQYACTECGHQLEARQGFHDDPLTECPACAGRLRKVLSAVGVVFKGSGFYRTDSRKDAAGATSGGKAEGASTSNATGGDSGSKGSTRDSGSSTSSSNGSTSTSKPSSAPAAASTG